MRILVITFNFHGRSPRALKWRNLVNEMRRVHEVDVICGDKFFKKVNQNKVVTTDSRIKVILRGFRWPDYGARWLLATILREKPKKKYDLLISVSHPFSSHLLGLWFRRLANKWFLDIGDPFEIETQIRVNNRIFQRINEIIESYVLREADMIYVTTRDLGEAYEKKLCAPNKVREIHPLCTQEVYKYKRPASGRFVYCGRFYTGVRPIESLIKFARLLKGSDSEFNYVHIYGPIVAEYIEKVKNADLEEYVKFYGHSDEIENILPSYDYLLNFENQNRFQKPSKLWDLICSGLPIVNVSAGANFHTSQYLQSPFININVLQNIEFNKERVQEFRQISSNIQEVQCEEIFRKASVFAEEWKVKKFIDRYLDEA